MIVLMRGDRAFDKDTPPAGLRLPNARQQIVRIRVGMRQHISVQRLLGDARREIQQRHVQH